MMLRTGWGVTPGFGMIGIKSMNYRSSHAASSPSSWSRHCSPYIALCVFIVCWLGSYIRHLSTLHQTRSLIFPKVHILTSRFLSDRSDHHFHRAQLNPVQCLTVSARWQDICLSSLWKYTFAVNIVQIVGPAIWKSNINQQRYNTGDMSHDHRHRPLNGGAVTNCREWPWAGFGHFLDFGGEFSPRPVYFLLLQQIDTSFLLPEFS